MKIAGHLAGGYLMSHWLIEHMAIQTKEKKSLLVSGTISGILPDLDFIWHVLKKRKIEYKSDFRHHNWISHTFPFYWTPALLLFSVGAHKRDQKLKHQAAIIAGAATTHIIQDTIGSGDGIMLLYPFSKQKFGIALSGLHGDEWNAHYIKSPIYLVELTMCIIAGISFIADLLKKSNLSSDAGVSP